MRRAIEYKQGGQRRGKEEGDRERMKKKGQRMKEGGEQENRESKKEEKE